ncbi:MAG: hypothetical protein JOS17DRAFT_751702 [Linnemannia elongata]|nr:MAG: hypothetical protein JOS17DRAFT_751702 [Linnemannia elongata]
MSDFCTRHFPSLSISKNAVASLEVVLIGICHYWYRLRPIEKAGIRKNERGIEGEGEGMGYWCNPFCWCSVFLLFFLYCVSSHPFIPSRHSSPFSRHTYELRPCNALNSEEMNARILRCTCIPTFPNSRPHFCFPYAHPFHLSMKEFLVFTLMFCSKMKLVQRSLIYRPKIF